MTRKPKLELTWIGKDERPRLEPRILIEDPLRSHHAAAKREGDIFDNMLIHGDNLLALKALESTHAGKVKCVFIDPPYNTGSAFEHYDDGIEHSLWLSLMRDRLSLRKPQERSLEILHQVLNATNPDEFPAALAEIRKLAGGNVQKVEEFERDFVSLCFALATGVGKTRLMGAFITYLALTRRSKHFFVLAPNTTIYEKLIDDFTPGKPKYVFKGIAEFAQSPPQLVTGDNWDQGRGLRRQGELLDADVIINVFNVDKINKDVGRIRTLRETLGVSYYDYLAELPDLVLLMDEAHRYRAKAGFKAIADLKPMLGLELTATPKTVGAKSLDFKNVIYRYGLAEAMEDGFVKEPAVATRNGSHCPRGQRVFCGLQAG